MLTTYIVFFGADIDECVAETSPCHSKATCTNIPGSFICTQPKLLNILIGTLVTTMFRNV